MYPSSASTRFTISVSKACKSPHRHRFVCSDIWNKLHEFRSYDKEVVDELTRFRESSFGVYPDSSLTSRITMLVFALCSSLKLHTHKLRFHLTVADTKDIQSILNAVNSWYLLEVNILHANINDKCNCLLRLIVATVNASSNSKMQSLKLQCMRTYRYLRIRSLFSSPLLFSFQIQFIR